MPSYFINVAPPFHSSQKQRIRLIQHLPHGIVEQAPGTPGLRTGLDRYLHATCQFNASKLVHSCGGQRVQMSNTGQEGRTCWSPPRMEVLLASCQSAAAKGCPAPALAVQHRAGLLALQLLLQQEGRLVQQGPRQQELAAARSRPPQEGSPQGSRFSAALFLSRCSSCKTCTATAKAWGACNCPQSPA